MCGSNGRRRIVRMSEWLVVIEDGERQVFGAREAHLLGEIQIGLLRNGIGW